MGRFASLIRMYKAPPANAMTEEFYETDRRATSRAASPMQSVAPLPITFAKEMVVAKGAWGWGLRALMMDYNHWASSRCSAKSCPWEDNRVELAEETDDNGLPVAKVTFDFHDNDTKLIDWGRNKVDGDDVGGRARRRSCRRRALRTSSARPGWATTRESSVVDRFGRTHDIANLFVCDGSILPTQGAANPGLTIHALAARTADYLISQGESIFTSDRRDMARPPLRRELAPPGTWGKGVPRIR